MSQNTSHAVMAQRTESPDSLDDFPTPPWATRAFVEHVLGGKTSTSGLHVFHTDAWCSGYDLAYHPLRKNFGGAVPQGRQVRHQMDQTVMRQVP